MIYQRIKKLADLNNVSIYRVERDSGLSNGAISKWGRTANQTPSSESLKKVADYFDVSVDFLLGSKQKNKVMKWTFSEKSS